MNDAKIEEAVNEIYAFLKKHKYCSGRECNFNEKECVDLQKKFADWGIRYFEGRD